MSCSVPVLDYVGTVAPEIPFGLIDVGCSGGIADEFLRFGPRLRALGVDSNVAEIDRLRAAETHPGIAYLAALAGLPEGHPLLALKTGREHWGRNPWSRLAVVKSLEAVRARTLTPEDQRRSNVWQSAVIADTVVLPDYLRAQGTGSVDFLKIDVDGPDLEILHSFDTALDSLGIVGVGLEVNFFGSDAPTDHSFHNMDRFMKARGFELLNLTVSRYAVAALSGRYQDPMPGKTLSGCVLQGDAFYARDLASAEQAAVEARLGADKLLNLMCILAAFDLPDCAAEVLLCHRDRMSPHWDVARLLDLLAAQGHTGPTLSYPELMSRFERHDAMFFPPVLV